MFRVGCARHVEQTACFVSALLAIDTALCGSPFQTDDPNVVAYRRAEVLSYYQSTLTESGRFGALPGVELHYGLFERTELDVVLPYAFNIAPDGTAAHGYGDTIVGIKYALVTDSDGFLLSAVPRLSFASGNASRGLGNSGSAAFLALSAQKSVGSFTTYATGGYWLNNGEGNRDYGFVGWEAQYKLSDRLTLGGEVFYNGPAVNEQRSSVGFNLGGIFEIRPGIQILLSMGRGLLNATQSNRVSTYIGALFGF